MTVRRHCRHCLGDCDGSCLLPGQDDLCIHHPVRRLTMREHVLLLGDRRFWHRVFWGL
jgi:hypothetical protein